MISVIFHSDEKGQLISYEARGHSGYAESGSDIICAGVSVLSATCLNSLESVCGIIAVLKVNTDGHIAYALPKKLSDAQMHDAQILMKALLQGIRDMIDVYPKFIRLSMK